MSKEMTRLKAITTDNRNPKSVKAAALERLRYMERQAGMESIPYNSSGY